MLIEIPTMNEDKNYIKYLLSLYSCSRVQGILVSQPLSRDQQKDAHTFWTEYGHRIRERINDDAKLEALLKIILPQYNGDSVTIFRGENKKRYENSRIGFCWTSDIDTARMFARGLNSYRFGGVLLRHTFHPDQIIAGPSPHSFYLGENEFTIAPSSLKQNSVELLESYPPIL